MSLQEPEDEQHAVTENPTRRTGTSWLLLAVVFVVALLLLATGAYFLQEDLETQEKEREEKIGEVTALFEETKQRQREKLESGDAVGAGKQAEEDLAGIAAKISEAKQSFSGDDAKIFDATNKLIARTQEHLGTYNQAVAELYESGLVRAATLPTLEDLHARRELVKKFRETNARFQQYQMTAPQTYRALLEEQDVKPATLQQAMAGFEQAYGQQKGLILTVRQSDEKFAVLLLEILDLLENHWGRWEYSEAEEMITFEDDAVVEDYQEALAELEQVAVAQAEAQEKLLQAGQPAAPAAPTAPKTGFTPTATPDDAEQPRP